MPSRDPADEFLQAFGQAVRRAREARGLSQESLGFDAGLDRTYVSGIERGVRNPTVRTSSGSRKRWACGRACW